MSSIELDWVGRNRFIYVIVKGLISLIVRMRLIRTVVEGEENVPESGSVMLMVNHQSNLDPLLVGWATRRPLTMPGKVELFRIPLLRTIISELGCFPVDRDANDAGALRKALTVLREGHVLAVFPEGTRSRSGQVGAFVPTLTRLAIHQQAQVVPVAVDGSGAFLPPGERIPKVGAMITIRFGRPIDLAPLGPKPTEEEVNQATEGIRTRVIELLTAPA